MVGCTGGRLAGSLVVIATALAWSREEALQTLGSSCFEQIRGHGAGHAQHARVSAWMTCKLSSAFSCRQGTWGLVGLEGSSRRLWTCWEVSLAAIVAQYSMIRNNPVADRPGLTLQSVTREERIAGKTNTLWMFVAVTVDRWGQVYVYEHVGSNADGCSSTK